VHKDQLGGHGRAVTVTGKGFGSAPTGGKAISSLTDCEGTGTGFDYPDGQAWFVDTNTTESWGAGALTGKSGTCVGIHVVSWSGKQVVFTFGSDYGSGGWILHDNDGVTVSIKGSPGYSTVPPSG
jgi:hypothetical protein